MKKELQLNTQQKIIKIATELFAQNGFEGTSVREICKNAGVNISLISYYFGGKEELYKVVVDNITKNIINYMLLTFGKDKITPDINTMKKNEKIELFFILLERLIDYFYSDNISDSDIMIIFREQMISGIPINAEGYKFFKRLLASILEKDEDDKEIILRTISIIGQVHSPRIFKQFSLNLMNQSGYSKEDVQMLKQIIINQTKVILKDFGI